MHSCDQTKGQTIYQHGLSVQNYLFDLLNHLNTNSPLQYSWQLPDWVLSNKELILKMLPDEETLKLYSLHHDIGKPFCKEIDVEGKTHFPNHAQVSYEVFSHLFKNDLAAELILHDMDIHTLKAEQIPDWYEANKHLAIPLLLTGLAEVHSNAQLFGGISSISYKIKIKCITQRGKQIINLINKNDGNIK